MSLCKRCPKQWKTPRPWIPLRKSSLFKVYVKETLKTYKKIGIRVSKKDRQRVEATPHRIVSRRVLEIYDDLPLFTFKANEVEGMTPEDAIKMCDVTSKQPGLPSHSPHSFLSSAQVSSPLPDGAGSPSQ